MLNVSLFLSLAVTWDGVGAGGTGPAYSWTAHSFSPVRHRQIDIKFTHDHSSYANYVDPETGDWVTGGHEKYPVRETRPASWFSEINRMAKEAMDGLNGTNGTNATAVDGTDGNNASLAKAALGQASAYDFWSKIFPIEKGYSHNLFGRADDGANATNGIGNSTSDAPNAAEEEKKEEVDDAVEVAQGEAEEDYSLKRRGIHSPMVFNDLPVIAGYQPVTKPWTIVPVHFDDTKWQDK